MKTINIPTSFAEFKQMMRERKSKRMRHNISVLTEFAKAISKIANQRDWSDHISDRMKKNAFSFNWDSQLYQEYTKAKSKLR